MPGCPKYYTMRPAVTRVHEGPCSRSDRLNWYCESWWLISGKVIHHRQWQGGSPPPCESASQPHARHRQHYMVIARPACMVQTSFVACMHAWAYFSFVRLRVGGSDNSQGRRHHMHGGGNTASFTAHAHSAPRISYSVGPSSSYCCIFVPLRARAAINIRR